MKATQGQLMLSIGALLASEREKRGIPVERAAKETRMRPQRIRDMEADDLSHFTNPSYARMFLIAYAKYLGIPMQTIREHLPDRGEPGTEGYQYIHAATEELPSLRANLTSRPIKRHGALTALLAITAAVVLGGAVVLITYLVVNVNRLTERLDKPVASPTPEPVAVAEASPSPSPAPTASIGLTDVVSTPAPAAPLEQDVQLAELPTPTPETTLATSPTPQPGASPAASPAAPSAADEDREFLLGATPDQSPPAESH
jgi:cytoskeletal protein RodZ